MVERILRSNPDKTDLLLSFLKKKQEDPSSVQLSPTIEPDHQSTNSTMESNSLTSTSSNKDIQMVLQMLQKMEVEANKGVQEMRQEVYNRMDQAEFHHKQVMKNIQNQIDAMNLVTATTKSAHDQSLAIGNGHSTQPQVVESGFGSHMQSQNLLRMALDK